MASIAVAIVLLPALTAHAGGFEVPAPGVRGMGRAGAFAARADDPLAILYNPAALYRLADPQLLLNVNILFYDACFARRGTYGEFANQPNLMSRFGTIASDFGSASFPEVCRENDPALLPFLVFGMPITDDLGIAFGLTTPVGSGNNQWETTRGGVFDASGRELPSPTRYMVADMSSRFLSMSAGVGYHALPWLSVGATFHWGFALVDTDAYTVIAGGEDPGSEIRTQFEVNDLFVPGITASALLEPTPEIDATIGFTHYDDIHASGSATLVYGDLAPIMPVAPSPVRTETPISPFNLDAPRITKIFAGARYAQRRRSSFYDGDDVFIASSRSSDPMTDEVFDVELDIGYELNSRVDEFVVTTPMGARLQTRTLLENGTTAMVPLPIGEIRRIQKHWKNQLTLHLGGDYNVIPGVLALRGGFAFETLGVDPNYMGVDFTPGQRLSVHLGATFREGNFDLSLAYMHGFQADITATSPMLLQTSTLGTPTVINGGTLTAAWNIVTLGATYHFR